MRNPKAIDAWLRSGAGPMHDRRAPRGGAINSTAKYLTEGLDPAYDRGYNKGYKVAYKNLYEQLKQRHEDSECGVKGKLDGCTCTETLEYLENEANRLSGESQEDCEEEHE